MNHVREPVMIVHDHPELGLPVVVVDRRVEHGVEPAHDFRVQRFARAAHDAQLALHACCSFGAGRHQHPVCGRRTGEARDAEPFDHVVRAVDREAAFVQRRRVTEQQRAGDRVVEAVGPARIGDVPEAIAGAQVDRVAHVRAEREQRAQRTGTPFGRPVVPDVDIIMNRSVPLRGTGSNASG
jgi:hypothetical protein